MNWSRTAVIIISGAVGGLVGYLGTSLGPSEFGVLPLAGPGYLLLRATGLISETGANPVPLTPLLFANMGIYGLFGLLLGAGYTRARQSRFWRVTLGIVVGTVVGVDLLTLAFLPLESPFLGTGQLMVAVLVLAVAPVVGVISLRRLIWRPQRTPKKWISVIRWPLRVLAAILIGYVGEQLMWFVYLKWQVPAAPILRYWQSVWQTPWHIHLFTLAGLTIPVLVYAALTYRYGPRSDYERQTLCRKCGYVLRGISEPRCPECGERI